jgi:MOSC domain-containing protein YiiM
VGGTVEAIYVAERPGQPMRAVDAVVGEAHRGLLGDRHYRPNGGPEAKGRQGEVQDLTLVEAEVLQLLLDEHGIELSGPETRRNILVRGVRLNDLIGKQFRLGGLLCEGTEICEPCAHLQKKAGKPVLKPLVHRGGLRARILEGGTLRVGDEIAVLEAAVTPAT